MVDAECVIHEILTKDSLMLESQKSIILQDVYEIFAFNNLCEDSKEYHYTGYDEESKINEESLRVILRFTADGVEFVLSGKKRIIDKIFDRWSKVDLKDLRRLLTCSGNLYMASYLWGDR